MSRFSNFLTSNTKILGWQPKSIYLDMGSANTRVFFQKRLIHCQPTCLLINELKQVASIGTKAFDYLGKTPARLKVIFPIREGVLADKKVMQLYLMALFKKLNFDDKKGLPTFANIVVATPAGAFPYDLELLRTAFTGAGFFRVYLQKKSQAAMQYLMKKKNIDSACIVDVGAETIETTIFINGELLNTNSFLFGGISLTESIQNLIKKDNHLGIGWRTAERIKFEVGLIKQSASKKKKQTKITLAGKDLINNISKTTKISHEDLQDPFHDFAGKLVHELQLYFGSIPAEILFQALDNGVHLIGGGSQLKGLKEYLETYLKTEVYLTEKPLEVVVRGMALNV